MTQPEIYGYEDNRVRWRLVRCIGGLALWTGRGMGWKIKHERAFYFSDRYVHRKWHLVGGWWLVRVV